jgi:iron-sulfur cluster assembly accessory protein
MALDLTITPAAEKFIRRMMRFADGPHGGFRLMVTAGGCSGLSATFGTRPAPERGDAVVNVGGLTLFLPAESRMLLEGVTIDFQDTAASTGFVFRDPKQPTCGCASDDSPTTRDVFETAR